MLKTINFPLTARTNPVFSALKTLWIKCGINITTFAAVDNVEKLLLTSEKNVEKLPLLFLQKSNKRRGGLRFPPHPRKRGI